MNKARGFIFLLIFSFSINALAESYVPPLQLVCKSSLFFKDNLDCDMVGYSAKYFSVASAAGNQEPGIYYLNSAKGVRPNYPDAPPYNSVPVYTYLNATGDSTVNIWSPYQRITIDLTSGHWLSTMAGPSCASSIPADCPFINVPF